MRHPAPPQNTARPPASAALRVALIADDGPLRAVLSEAFADEGWAVTAHRTPAEALATRRPDVIVADDTGWNVWELSAADRAAIRAVAGVAPTIVCSWRDWASTLAPGELGLAGVLAMPFDIDDLRAAVLRAAGRPD